MSSWKTTECINDNKPCKWQDILFQSDSFVSRNKSQLAIKMNFASLFVGKFSNLIIFGVAATVTIVTVATVAVVVDSPTDPTIAPETTTVFKGSGTDTTSDEGTDRTTIDEGSGDDGSGSGSLQYVTVESDLVQNSKILKLLFSNPVLFENDKENEEHDLISEGFIRLYL